MISDGAAHEITPGPILGADDSDWSRCPPGVLRILKTLVVPAHKKGVLLDVCAGDGNSAVMLARAWNLKPYLVEPNTGRFAACGKHKHANSVLGRAESVSTTCPPSVWFFNPPFDPDDPTGYLEHSLLEVAKPYAVGPNTLCILLLPERSLRNKHIVGVILEALRDVRIRYFPNPWRSQFRQLVVFGYGAGVEGSNPITGPDKHSLISNLRRRGKQLLQSHEFALQIKTIAERFSIVTRRFNFDKFNQCG
jgi:hypothetical protein